MNNIEWPFPYLRTEFVSYFFVLGRVLGHFCNDFLYFLLSKAKYCRNVLGRVLGRKNKVQCPSFRLCTSKIRGLFLEYIHIHTYLDKKYKSSRGFRKSLQNVWPTFTTSFAPLLICTLFFKIDFHCLCTHCRYD